MSFELPRSLISAFSLAVDNFGLFLSIPKLSSCIIMSLLSFEESKSLLASFTCSLLHVHARSLPKNYDNITAFIDSLCHSFSFLCVTETRLGSCDGNLYGFQSFNS